MDETKEKVKCKFCHQVFEIDPKKETLPIHHVPDKRKRACGGAHTKEFYQPPKNNKQKETPLKPLNTL